MPANLITIITSLPDKCLHPNARTHWAAKASATKKQRTRTGDEATIARLDSEWQPAKLATIQLHYVLTRPRRGGEQRHDPDNLISWAKSSIDGLTDGGILTDDRDVIYLPPTQNFCTDKLHSGELRIDVERGLLR